MNNSEQVDPLTWISAERQVATDFVTAQSEANIDLNGSIAEFKKEIEEETSVEAKFTDELALLKGMVNPIAIAQTLTMLTNEGSSIDDAFLRLQSNIIKNNESAKFIVQDIASSVENVSELNKTRIDIGNKITNYKNIIGTFRNFRRQK